MNHTNQDNLFTKQVGIEYPIICGAMFPCSNPELVAAASEAGGIGIIQPVSLVYAHGYEFREGLKYIKTLTNKPLGINILVEKSSKVYEQRMKQWLDIAIEEGVKFFITALGNPQWVIDKARSINGIVYHDVTNKKWAQKAIDCGVDGLICVNNRAGGHAGEHSPEELAAELSSYGLPLICAGGISTRDDYLYALKLGYSGIQMGTRFIASKECKVHPDYQNAIISADEKDIVLTDKITGVPVSVINTNHIKKIGTSTGWLSKFLLKHPKTKHIMRILYTLRASWQLTKASSKGNRYKDYFQAGKSVAGIRSVETVNSIISSFVKSS